MTNIWGMLAAAARIAPARIASARIASARIAAARIASACVAAALLGVPPGAVGAMDAMDATGAPGAPSADEAAAQRELRLGAQLRCLVCQNQSVADSHAPLALDLRRAIREQIAAGRSDREVLDFMVERYGDFVLYRPPLRPDTLLLWAAPALFAAAGFALLRRSMRAHRERDEAAPGADEHGRVAALSSIPAERGP